MLSGSNRIQHMGGRTYGYRELKIRCWNCGREEEVVERFQDDIVDFNLDKPCPACSDSWMTKKELTMKRTVNEEMRNKYHSVVRGG